MAIFVGTAEEFNTYIGPRMRNLVQTMSKGLKRAAGNVCERCGGTFPSLDAAHIHGRERRDLIAQTLREYEQDGLYVIPSLDEFEEKFKKAHEPVRDTFLFLCRDCHREYDREQGLEEGDVIPIDDPSNARASHFEKGYLRPDSTALGACGGEIDEHPRNGESFQDFVKRTLGGLFERGMITGNELELLQQADYSKRTFGLSFPLIVQGLSNTTVSGHARYWRREPIFEDYYACNDWWKQKIPMYEEKFAAWVRAMKRTSGCNSPR